MPLDMERSFEESKKTTEATIRAIRDANADDGALRKNPYDSETNPLQHATWELVYRRESDKRLKK